MNSYKKQLSRAKAKERIGIPLKKGEAEIVKGKYFFTFLWPYDKFEEYCQSLDGKKPNLAIWELICDKML